MISLSVENGPDYGASYEINSNVALIGRDASCAVTLTDEKVSRRHARTELRDDQHFIIDLSSRNGTFVNERRVRVKRIDVGDRIKLGGTTLLVRSLSSTAGVNELQTKFFVDPKLEQETPSVVGDDGRRGYVDSLLGRFDPRLFRKDQEKLRAIYKTCSVVNSILETDALLQSLLDLIFETIDGDRGFIILVDPDTGALTPKAVRPQRESPDLGQMGISRTILHEVIKTKKGILSPDAMSDPRFSNHESIIENEIRSVMCVPVKSKDDVLGVIHIDTTSSSGQFTQDDLELLEAIANEAGVAIRGAQLHEEKMRAESMAQLGQATARVSHYIKNILMGFKGGADIVKRSIETKDFDRLRKGWDIVERNENKISELVLNMLNISQDKEPAFEPYDLNALVNEVVGMVESTAAQNSTKIKLKLMHDMPEVSVDPEGIRRCVLNLLTNAIDAIGEGGGTITISTTIDEYTDEALILVRDTGCGIPEEKIAKIFDMFETTKGHKGTGLGLAVSKRFVNAHGGRIDVESTVGEGSAFTVKLPRGEH